MKTNLKKAIKILQQAGFKVRHEGKRYFLTEPVIGIEEETSASDLIKMSDWYNTNQSCTDGKSLKHQQKRRDRVRTKNLLLES
jgi:hypothetical protein